MKLRHGVRGVLLALVGSLAMVSAAAADDGAGGGQAPVRSIASAQDFLHQVLPGNRYISTPMAEMLAKARRENLRGSFDPLPVIVEAVPVASCVSRLRADVAPTWLVVRNPQDGWDTTEAPVEELLGERLIGNPDGMHFGSVRAVRRAGAEVHVRFAGNSDDAVLYLDAVQTAERVHGALEFLRLHCDATRATGF